MTPLLVEAARDGRPLSVRAAREATGARVILALAGAGDAAAKLLGGVEDEVEALLPPAGSPATRLAERLAGLPGGGAAPLALSIPRALLDLTAGTPDDAALLGALLRTAARIGLPLRLRTAPDAAPQRLGAALAGLRRSTQLAQPGEALLVLRTLESSRQYARWIAARVGPFLGARVAEIGAGLGTITEEIRVGRRVIAIEPEPLHAAGLRRRLGAHGSVTVVEGRAEDDAVLAQVAALEPDTVLATNVLEHIPDDVGAVHRLAERLPTVRRFVVLVPAHELLRGPLDDAVGHVRRYSRRSLERCLVDAGLRVEALSAMNPLGLAGWFVNVKLLRRRTLSRTQVRTFDRLAPTLEALEQRFGHPPIGLSLVAVGVRP